MCPAVQQPGLHLKRRDNKYVVWMYADYGYFFTGHSYSATSPLLCQVKSRLYMITQFKWQAPCQCTEDQDSGQTTLQNKKNKTPTSLERLVLSTLIFSVLKNTKKQCDLEHSEHDVGVEGDRVTK